MTVNYFSQIAFDLQRVPEIVTVIYIWSQLFILPDHATWSFLVVVFVIGPGFMVVIMSFRESVSQSMFVFVILFVWCLWCICPLVLHVIVHWDYVETYLQQRIEIYVDISLNSP